MKPKTMQIIGIVLIVSPVPLLMLNFGGYALLSAMANSSYTGATIAITITRFALGLGGVLSITVVPLIGVVLLVVASSRRGREANSKHSSKREIVQDQNDK